MACILVIEDNPSNMKLAVFLLTKEGHEVLQAPDAEEGLRIARQRLPVLILMDVQLPGMDGLAATRLLKADAATHHIKIVALTAFAMRGDQEKNSGRRLRWLHRQAHSLQSVSESGGAVAGLTFMKVRSTPIMKVLS